jgi:hypothetical protein
VALVKHCQCLLSADAHKCLIKPLPFFEIARTLVRLDHVASTIVNAKHSTTPRPAVGSSNLVRPDLLMRERTTLLGNATVNLHEFGFRDAKLGRVTDRCAAAVVIVEVIR